MTLSGVQRQALSLYRAALRSLSKRPSREERASLGEYARAEFEKHRRLKRSDTLRIEFLLRQGRKKLDSIAGGSGFSLVSPTAPTPTKPPFGGG